MKGKIGVFLILALLLGLAAGCAKDPVAKGGTLYIHAGSSIVITYDGDGNVVSVAADSENAQEIVDGYQDYEGKSCDQVVSEIVEKVGQAGLLEENASIEVKFSEGAEVPQAGFAENLEQKIQDTVEKNGWESTVQVAPPATEVTEDSQQDTQPAVPAGAELQADGTYILTEYFNKGGKKVDSEEAAHSICVTVYNAAGNSVSKERTEKGSGQLRERYDWEYDAEGGCLALLYAEYSSDGVIQEHYREEYDGQGRVVLKNTLEKDGSVFSTTAYSYYGSGGLKTEEEVGANGITLAKKEYAESGNMISEAGYYADGTPESLTEYDGSGTKTTETYWNANGRMRYYEEFYSNGYSKNHRTWNSDGVLIREFLSFHGEDPQNGILAEYDNSGTMTSRSTEGNPDGSPAVWEIWTEENGGEYIMYIYEGPYMAELDEDGNLVKEARIVEERYTLADGSYHNHTYNYENGTMHTVGYWVNGNATRDMITGIGTDTPVEGYTESTIDGVYRRQEWKDGAMVLEIQDGARVMGYTVRDTTTYYPNGQVKTAERYFYADGGRIYTEYDENGNETYSEVTTGCWF